MKTLLYAWIKKNSVMLLNAGSLIGTTAVTGVFGFAYWWIAARHYPPQAVGLASAAVSAMTLLGAISLLGLGTLLIGELPRHPGKEASLISAALILVGAVGACAGIIFVLVAPLVSPAFLPFRTNVAFVLLFAAGVSLTAIISVLDSALIGLLKGSLQFWRNTLFAIAKLLILLLASFGLAKVGTIIYGTWVAGILLSLVPFAAMVIFKVARLGRSLLPDWALLHRLRVSALEHHMLNLVLQIPGTALPVLVTILLSATTNAWFYVAWMISGLVFITSFALTTVLFAINAGQTHELMHKIRVTLGLALLTSLLCNCLLLFAAPQILAFFGHTYAVQAAWCLRILGFGAFPVIIIDHYMAVSRINRKVAQMALPIATLGCLLELGLAAVGAHFGGLDGLSFGWDAALYLEAAVMFPTVYRAAFPASFSPLKRVEKGQVSLPPPSKGSRPTKPEKVKWKCTRVSAGREKMKGMKRLFPLNTSVLLKSIRCTKCNALLPPSANFCGLCGAKLDKSVKVWSRTAILSHAAFILLPLCAFALWFLSLRTLDLGQMTDLGLVSVLPLPAIFALILLVVSFCLALQQKRLSGPLLFFHLLLLIFMLYGVTTLVEQQPRFSIVYEHAGYTEFILRNGRVDPYLDAYFNWPGFFLLSAFLTQIAGYHDILSYAVWAPVYFNLFYLFPLYSIFATATTDKRIIWLALCFFYLTNWIAQDYYSPQGLNFFFYLLILAILLKWFKRPLPASPQQQAKIRQKLGKLSSFIGPIYAWLTAADTLVTPVQPRQRRALLASVIVIFAFMVFSHPLTPFFMLAAVTVLVVFGRITPRWLPILMAVMIVAWSVFMAQPYLAGHLASILSDIGQIGRAITSNVTSRVATGDPQHVFIGEIRTLMTLIIWGLACVGALLRLRQGYHDASYVLLAVVLFPIVLIQSYGGEMLLRVYLFTLPLMVFFAAALFYTLPAKNLLSRKVWSRPASRVQEKSGVLLEKNSLLPKILVGVTCVVLLVGFLFTRYGNERVDYVTNAELTGIRHLYSIAPQGSMLIAGWDGTPWQFQDIEHYDYYVLADDTHLADAVLDKNVVPVVRLIAKSNDPYAYLIFTRTQRASIQSSGLPANTLNRFEQALLASHMFVQVYNNGDAQIFLFIGERGNASP